MTLLVSSPKVNYGEKTHVDRLNNSTFYITGTPIIEHLDSITTDCTGNWIVIWIVLTLENTSGLILLDTGHCSH